MQNEGRPDEETEVEKDHVAAVDLTTGDRADGQEDNHTGQGQGLNADNDKEEVNSDANNNVEQSIMQSTRKRFKTSKAVDVLKCLEEIKLPLSLHPRKSR